MSKIMREWLTSHDGMRVHTIQGNVRSVWAPMDRTVDASRATYVRLEGSRRDYAGMSVKHHTESVLVTVDSSSDTLCVYFVPGTSADDVIGALEAGGITLPSPYLPGVTVEALRNALGM